VSISMTLNGEIGFSFIFFRFPAATHILRVNYADMAGDGPGQPAYGIVLAYNVHF